jgi:hypothetical protein
MQISSRSLAAGSILAAALTGMGSAGEASAVGQAEVALERVLARSNAVAPPPYRALRRMEGGLSSSDKRGWLEVWTEHQPGRGLTFEVVGEGGSEYVRNKILRNMLKSEQKLIAKGRRLRASLESKNYEFADGGLTESGLQRVLLKPVKVSDGIVNGSLWLEPGSGYVRRIEGRLVKSPSFWLRDVDVTWKFAPMGGHLVPIEMTSTGRVRMFGRSNFRMTYEYATIDGRPANALSAEIRDER